MTYTKFNQKGLGLVASSSLFKSTSLNANSTTLDLLKEASIIYFNYKDQKYYSYLPFGNIVLSKIEAVIRDIMNRNGVIELQLTQIQPLRLWEVDSRLREFQKNLVYLKGYTSMGERYILSPTNEEVTTLMAKSLLNSYRQLPISFYQINDKYRDDSGTKYGILRSNVFRILEAYSFNRDWSDLDKTAKHFEKLFYEVFKEFKLKLYSINDRNGYTSLVYFSDIGVTKFLKCLCGFCFYYPKVKKCCSICKTQYKSYRGTDLAVIMKEGDRYSKYFNAYYLDNNTQRRFFSMGTYAIGISRLIYALVDKNRDKLGIK